MNSHLVTIEVGVERGTNERMKFDSFTFYKDRLKCLDTQTMQCRCTVQHNRMFFDNIFQYIPYFRLKFLYHFLGILDVVGSSVCNKLFHNERFEKLDCHFFRKTTLIDLQFRSNDDNRTSGIVNSFTKKVLTETSGFTFQHVRKGFESSVSRSCYRTATTTIVDQRVYCFLKHTFLITNNDIRCSQFQKTFQTVVTVDDSSVQIIQVRCCKTSTIELYHRTKIWRNNRDCSHDHPLRTVSGFTERFYNFQSLDDSGTFLSSCIYQFCLELLSIFLKIDRFEKFHNRFCTHSNTEIVSVCFTGILIFFLSENLFVLKSGVSRIQYNIVCKV